MNLRLEPERFQRRLAAWGIRAVLCAAPSFLWANLAGFNQPVQWVAMGARVATYAVAFAWVTSLPVYFERVEFDDFGWALRVAANTRAAMAPLMFFGPDGWLGFISLQVVRWGARMGQFDDIAKTNSFAWTYATTMTQGVLVTATMIVLAVLVWIPRRLFWRQGRAQ